MTLAARVAGSVIFSGQGLCPVVKVSNGASNGEPIVLEGIRFVDGALANHVNEHAATGGGALGLYGGRRALVVFTSFTLNRARNQGRAL